MLDCYPVLRPVLRAARHHLHWRGVGHHYHIHHVAHPVQTSVPSIVCRKVVAGLLGGGLALLPPASAPIGPVGGYPAGAYVPGGIGPVGPALGVLGPGGSVPGYTGGFLPSGPSGLSLLPNSGAPSAVAEETGPIDQVGEIGQIGPETDLDTSPITTGQQLAATPPRPSLYSVSPSSLNTPVPEPSSALTLLPGLAALALFLRRRR
jgi:hypothetical protein